MQVFKAVEFTEISQNPTKGFYLLKFLHGQECKVEEKLLSSFIQSLLVPDKKHSSFEKDAILRKISLDAEFGSW